MRTDPRANVFALRCGPGFPETAQGGLGLDHIFDRMDLAGENMGCGSGLFAYLHDAIEDFGAHGAPLQVYPVAVPLADVRRQLVVRGIQPPNIPLVLVTAWLYLT
jgi:hypothetical protein